MSEYQYYEFLAVDRPLDEQQLAQIRGLSTRATITATSFVNEYHWGDFRGDPYQLVQRYYDAHLYLANWGTRRCMLRLPGGVLDLDMAEQYCIDEHVAVWISGEDLVLEVASEDDEEDFVEGPGAALAVIVGVRSELAAGDLRALYLAWLAGVGVWERDEDAFGPEDDADLEPPVPAGLCTLTGAQQALADFLRLDGDLLDVAAQGSPGLEGGTDDPAALASWVASLAPAEKDRLLTRVVQDEPATVRLQLLRRFREHSGGPAIEQPRRTVAELLDAAAQRRAARARRASALRAEQEALKERERALAQQRRLQDLAGEGEGAWARVEEMIATRNPRDYDAAVALLQDLAALAERDGHLDTFTDRCAQLRQQHSRKSTLLDRLDQAHLGHLTTVR